ncbi:MAG: DUF2441 domain-containing protein [Lachnospiraceae bacterium]|nr:DUF2441 domain-containing protein [Lachnospiraceae bacterium]
MNTFYAYHVVTEHPMELGQHIVFDESNRSGVYRRVMSKLEIVEDIYAHPEKYEEVELEYPVMVALRELALEEVRQNKFPHLPSRMGCLYVSEHQEEAERWAEYFIRLGRPTYSIVKFKVTGSKFIGDATKCFDGTIHKQENLEMAEKYWVNGPNPEGEPPINEILVSGDLEVVEIVRTYQ